MWAFFVVIRKMFFAFLRYRSVFCLEDTIFRCFSVIVHHYTFENISLLFQTKNMEFPSCRSLSVQWCVQLRIILLSFRLHLFSCIARWRRCVEKVRIKLSQYFVRSWNSSRETGNQLNGRSVLWFRNETRSEVIAHYFIFSSCAGESLHL